MTIAPLSLDDGDHRQRLEGVDHSAYRPAPRQTQHVAVADDLAEEGGGGCRDTGVRLRSRPRDDDAVLEPEGLAQRRRAVGVDAERRDDLDPHHPALAGGLEEPGDLEPADAERGGEVHLGLAVDEVAAGDSRREDGLRGTEGFRHGAHPRARRRRLGHEVTC